MNLLRRAPLSVKQTFTNQEWVEIKCWQSWAQLIGTPPAKLALAVRKRQ